MIALIRKYSLALHKQRHSSDAWGEVNEQMARAGSYGQPKFTDPLTERVVKIMGWSNLCRSENESADRAHFMRMYDQLREQENFSKMIGEGQGHESR